MIRSEAELRQEERDAIEEMLQREHVDDLRNQLQAATELLREHLGRDPLAAIAERIERNRGK